MQVLRKTDQVYLAGPFFNKPQKDAAELIDSLCVSHCQKRFSPLLAGGGPLKSPEHAGQVFKRNIDEIRRSTVVLAQLEWLMEPDRQVRVVDPTGPNSGIFASPPLNIPDSGTVWEVGYASALRDLELETFRKDQEENPPRCTCEIGHFTCGVCMNAAAVRDGHTTVEKIARAKEMASCFPAVIAYTTAPQAKLNLMLARSCDGYLQGWDAVHQFLIDGILPDEARKFKGKEL